MKDICLKQQFLVGDMAVINQKEPQHLAKESQ